MQRRAKGASYTDRFNQKGSVNLDAKPSRGGGADSAKTKGGAKGANSATDINSRGGEAEGKISIFMNLDDIPDLDVFENSAPSPRKPTSSRQKSGGPSNSSYIGDRHSNGVNASYANSQVGRDVSTIQSFEVNEWGNEDFYDMPQPAAPIAGGGHSRQQQYSKPPVQQRAVVIREAPPLIQPQRIPNLPAFRQPLAAEANGDGAANPSGRGSYSGGSYRSTPQAADAQLSYNPSNDYTPFRHMENYTPTGNGTPAGNYVKAPSSGMQQQARSQAKYGAPALAGSAQYKYNKGQDDDEWSDDGVNDGAPGRDTPASYDNYDDHQNYGGGYEDDGYATGKAASQPRRGAKAPARQQAAQYSINVTDNNNNTNQSKRQFNLDNKLAAGRDKGHRPSPAMPSMLDVPALPCETDSSRNDLSPKDKLAYSRQPREVDYKPYTLQQYKIIKPKEYVEISNLKPDLNTDELRAKRANLERIKEFSKNLKSFNEKMIESQSRKPSTSSEASAMEISKKKVDSTRERALQFAKNIPRPKQSVPRADELDEEMEDGYMRSSNEQFGMDREKARALMDLEARYADSKRNVEAIKKAMNGGY